MNSVWVHWCERCCPGEGGGHDWDIGLSPSGWRRSRISLHLFPSQCPGQSWHKAGTGVSLVSRLPPSGSDRAVGVWGGGQLHLWGAWEGRGGAGLRLNFARTRVLLMAVRCLGPSWTLASSGPSEHPRANRGHGGLGMLTFAAALWAQSPPLPCFHEVFVPSTQYVPHDSCFPSIPCLIATRIRA